MILHPKIRRALVACAVLVASAPFALGAATYDDALAAKRAGDHPRAIALFQELAAAEPRNVDYLFHLGTVQGWAGRYDDALATIDRALALDPAGIDLQLARGRVLAWSGRLAEAEPIFRQLFAAHPENLDAQNMLGRVLAWQRQFDAADAVFEKILLDAPGNVDALIGRGDILRAQERRAEAREFYQRAQQVEPDSGDVRQRLASVERSSAWRVDVGYEHSSFTGGAREDWTGWDAAVRYALDRRTGLALSLERARRFGFVDLQYSLGVDRRFSDALSGYFRLSATPSADFFARHMQAAGLVWRVRNATPQWPQTFLSADYRAATYAPGTAHSLWLGVTQHLTHRLALTARVLAARNLNRRWTNGAQLRLDHEVSDEWRWHLGYADTKESLTPTLFDLTRELRTRALFGGIHHDLSSTWAVRVDVVHERTESGPTRRSFHVGLTTRF